LSAAQDRLCSAAFDTNPLCQINQLTQCKLSTFQ